MCGSQAGLHMHTQPEHRALLCSAETDCVQWDMTPVGSVPGCGSQDCYLGQVILVVCCYHMICSNTGSDSLGLEMRTCRQVVVQVLTSRSLGCSWLCILYIRGQPLVPYPVCSLKTTVCCTKGVLGNCVHIPDTVMYNFQILECQFIGNYGIMQNVHSLAVWLLHRSD